MSYASILRDLKRRVNPDELGVTVQGIREMHPKDLLVELNFPKEGRGRLDSAFHKAIGVSGTVRHLILRIEVEITNLESSIQGEEVEEAVREFCHQGPKMKLRVSLTKRPYRGTCTRSPRCYLCTVREKKPRVDHIPGTMRCAAFHKAAPNKKASRGCD